ncbi:hypothetical protein RJ639_042356 [Escallonia herrerae]|uniref:PHD and RING finger domain-containing protein 1 n=1 Tax=Escallonia herrerae TaxID=1293975 RepID=A0AA88WFE7_9ASTE|nr:hypothetical protein RJ639_042356 [Escallonia herrerae]
MATESESERSPHSFVSSPNKRRKTLTLDPPPSSPPPKSCKGKSMIEDEPPAAELESERCGICLSESGRSVRGRIDSCDHYFCFVCVMEWSRVESRCPLCKRRFSTIRRPAKEGVFPSERLLNVPVYHNFGNSTIGPPDLYSEIQCSMCESKSDDSLLLLCDLCDSAAHTYCVGLGATVPEGDWFCQDCTLLRDEHAKCEIDANCDGTTSPQNSSKMPSVEARVSIFDVVREPQITQRERPTTSYSHGRQLKSPDVLDEEVSVADNITGRDSVMQPIVDRSPTLIGARTLSHCRNVQSRIQALRQNWNAFRSGSLRFSSSSVDGCKVELSGRSGQPHSSSCLSQQLTAQKGSSCNRVPSKGSRDIDKAWKMMDAARSIGRGIVRTNPLGRDCERASIAHQASQHQQRKVNAQKEGFNTSSMLLTTSKQLGLKDSGTIRSDKHQQHCCLVNEDCEYRFPMCKTENHKWVGMKGFCCTLGAFPTTSPGDHKLPSSEVQTSFHVGIDHGNGGNLSRENFLGDLSNASNGNDRSACLNSPVRSVPISSSASSSYSADAKVAKRKSCADSKARKADNAKSEIQSLVKLNLKLLSGAQKLEVDAFKEIARLATHSILAACGLERLKPGVPSFQCSVCCHVDGIQQVRRSKMMRGSCRECFFVFVKDVVNAIMNEKIDVCGKVSC